jgi:hypothetical protein
MDAGWLNAGIVVLRDDWILNIAPAIRSMSSGP